MVKSKVRCAVIGLGMGKGHARGYHEGDDSELAAVADLSPTRLEEWAPVVGKENCYENYKLMLKEVKPDLVSVALPNFLHAPVTLDALSAGAHVLCEKPVATNLQDALKMQAAAEKAGRILGINLSYRFTGPARALKDLADAGFLGEPYHAYTKWTRRDGFPGFGGWFGQKELSGGGPLIDLGVHRLDLAMWLMGGPRPVSVSGTTHHKVGVPRAKLLGQKFDVEDFATGFVRFDTGASLVFEVSWAGHQADKEEMITRVTGTKGTLVHRNEGGGYHFVGESFSEASGHRLSARVEAGITAMRSPYQEMVECIRTGRPYLSGIEAGLNVQRILDGLYRSAQSGREVKFRD